ncbi:MAG: hypothetical protein KA408_00115 [Flavobacteriales bacterium]|nr:hypothetical protein [Flavobacteriales bacterium]
MAVSLALLSVHAQVDGFNKGKGNMDLVASLSYEQGLNYFLADGTANIKRNRIALSLFAARGLTDDLDVQLSIPFISTTGTSSFQDAQLFLKWLPVKAAVGNGKITFGAAIGGSTPMLDYETETGSAIGQQASSLTPMGVLQYMSGSGWFTSIVAGQQVVSAPTPDALTGTFRLGHASDKHYVEAYVEAQEAYGGKNYLGQGDLAPSSFKELGVSFLRVGAKYYKPIGSRSGIVAGASYVVSGRNVDQMVMVAGSYILHFRK